MPPSIFPVVVVLLMAVQTVWAGTVGVLWLIQHGWALWLRIVSGIRSARPVPAPDSDCGRSRCGRNRRVSTQGSTASTAVRRMARAQGGRRVSGRSSSLRWQRITKQSD